MTRLLSLFGLMRVSEHERSVRALESQLVLRENAFEAIEGERDRLSDEYKQAVADLEKQAREIARLKADFDLTPWKHCVGDPPDYESPLGCVYDSGVSYAYARLAEWLGVEDYEMGDGSEDYATDVGRTGANVLVAAGFVNDDGDLLTSDEFKALKADALAMRRKRQMDRDRRKGSWLRALPSDRAGGLRPEPAAQSQPSALIPSAYSIYPEMDAFLAEGEAKRIKFSERNPSLWADLLAKSTPPTLGVCRHLESEEADKACRCGYSGSVWADGEHVLFTMGDIRDPRFPELSAPRIDRSAEIASAQLLTCLFNNAEWLIELAAKAMEARQGRDGEAGSVHDSAVPQGFAGEQP